MKEFTADSLKTLIAADAQDEAACRDHLTAVLGRLVPQTGINLDAPRIEEPLRCGESDFIISGEFATSGRGESRCAYLWELKAPQCYVFRRDNNNRAKPSEDLIIAENQLLFFHDEVSGLESFKTELDISDRDNIRLGGIIIGCERRLAQGYQSPENTNAFRRAIRIRRKYFYDPLGIQLLTWDDVHQYLIEGERERPSRLLQNEPDWGSQSWIWRRLAESVTSNFETATIDDIPRDPNGD